MTGSMMDKAAFEIQFSPLLPDAWLIAIAVIGLTLFALAFWKNRAGLIFRSVTFAAFMLALLNPSLLEEKREAVSDVALIIVDQSPSQEFGERRIRTEEALVYLEEKLNGRENLDVRIIKAPAKNTLSNETLLYQEIEKALSDVPSSRRAGVIFISDGQIHDLPQGLENADELGPVHILLSGDKEEKDRQLVMVQTPSYGVIDQTVTVKYKIEDTENIGRSDATLTINYADNPPETMVVPVNEELMIDLPVMHAGQNVYEFSVAGVPDEITAANNRAAIIVNGVRDRLKVLLVSGKPHAGGRTWRDLLTSDPGVDLVHFTILREPSKLDATPQNELALIAFPFRELFEVKLYDFDLIIFDRYQLNRILPENYFDNIVRYVERGGALLEASGPSFASDDSVYYTSLMKILPGIPAGDVIKRPFKPHVTGNGLQHPVTKNLLWKANAQGEATWGNWLRQVDISRESGDTLMNGADDKPLLILDRVKDGRVAQIASDHIWLWSRGYDGGGPHTELLRRVVHWLMKEPELDEQALDVVVNGQNIQISAPSFKRTSHIVTMTKPDGTQETVELEKDAGGAFVQNIQANQLGIYSFEDSGGQKRHAVIGELNPPELRGVKTTDALITPIMKASGGGALWLSDVPQPNIRLTPPRDIYAGRHWLALRSNNDYSVTGVQSRSLLPPWLASIILLVLVVATWWREGRKA